MFLLYFYVSIMSCMHVDPSYDKAAHGICEVAEAVTHARFVGTSTASDEVVLMKILKVPHNEREKEGGSDLRERERVEFVCLFELCLFVICLLLLLN